jgi:hypothetical protein
MSGSPRCKVDCFRWQDTQQSVIFGKFGAVSPPKTAYIKGFLEGLGFSFSGFRV